MFLCFKLCRIGPASGASHLLLGYVVKDLGLKAIACNIKSALMDSVGPAQTSVLWYHPLILHPEDFLFESSAEN
jgi:hypothetical protein